VRQRIQILSDSLSSMFPTDSVQTTLDGISPTTRHDTRRDP
jgi:hypothetical protein